MKASKLILLLPLFFLMACSAAYEQVKEIDSKNPKNFKEHLLYNYKINASFEAEEMHDWNSAKLYSEKALRALSGENIYPEKITYWKLPIEIVKDIRSGYNNLLSIYDKAIIKDPKNLAKAISSLDCWAEQEEENPFMAVRELYKLTYDDWRKEGRQVSWTQKEFSSLLASHVRQPIEGLSLLDKSRKVNKYGVREIHYKVTE